MRGMRHREEEKEEQRGGEGVTEEWKESQRGGEGGTQMRGMRHREEEKEEQRGGEGVTEEWKESQRGGEGVVHNTIGELQKHMWQKNSNLRFPRLLHQFFETL
ncbi:unnamed protein product [Arctogadus glacialis]